MPTVAKTHTCRSIACMLLLAACVCTVVDEDGMTRSNPSDAGGDNWTVNALPVVDSVTADSLPTWSDFDFGDSTGAIDIVVHAHDLNQPYDTLRYVALIEGPGGTVDTAAVTADSFFTVSGLQRGQSYRLMVRAIDTWDSATTWSGPLRTPTGTPPPRPDSVALVPSANAVQVVWQLPPNWPASWRYVVYHSSDPHTSPFVAIHDTIPPAGNRSCTFWHAPDDYRMHYYLVAAANELGESRAADTLSGKAGSQTAVPTSVAARYVTCDTVQVGWQVSSSYGIDFYDVYRRDSSSSYYRLVGTVDVDEPALAAVYVDTVLSHRACWYRIATMTVGGVGSVLSDSARANVITNCRTPR